MSVPTYDELFNPLLKALHELGGSASVEEMDDRVAEILGLTDEEISEIHRGNTTKLSYRLAWSRNYLKRFGLLENSARGVWVLTPKGQSTTQVDKALVNKTVKHLDLELKAMGPGTDKPEELVEEATWRSKVLDEIKKMSPAAFERLCQRVLRESGFINVEVKGKSGDGGIDGRGIVKVGGLLGFRVIFQCKRYAGSVSSQEIREFKGTMVGRAEKGLFITTGTFTRDAKQEAVRDGSPPIDLIDGEEFAERLKELDLGVSVKTEELVGVDGAWFESF
ncbi:restriction endonuclease [Candidatus Amesbacteria bacterium RIFOXYB1_FULL_44_23]|uniref:Restriction endonuclease n=1 Tax=Candidatus Amesbacteria bacterium RIFOXYB1_FULL_44_23 TaxID=1797263 RepID=A0A1F4ZSH2_9BACT|nr:MAG: restriction endonuclease [Candidatus Amesbacteria bacterium RIFOXYB1_FULL_44_23]